MPWGGALLFDLYWEAIWASSIDIAGPAAIAKVEPFGNLDGNPEDQSVQTNDRVEAISEAVLHWRVQSTASFAGDAGQIRAIYFVGREWNGAKVVASPLKSIKMKDGAIWGGVR